MSVINRKLALAVSLIVAAAGTAGMSTGAWAICNGLQPTFGCKINGAGGPLTPCVSTGFGDTIEAPQAGCIVAGNTVGCVIEGGGGNDILVGSLLNDTICANGGTDFVFAQAGDDNVFMGDNPAGTIETGFGQFGDDILNGETGNDTLAGGQGPDTDNGGPGVDLCLEAQSTPDCEIVLSPTP